MYIWIILISISKSCRLLRLVALKNKIIYLIKNQKTSVK